MIVRRGDIFFADLSPVVGSEQGGIRPVLIVQNDIGNKYSPTVICAAITSQMNKAKLPTHIALSSAVYALPKDSVVLLEQIRTIDKQRLREKLCCLDDTMMRRVDRSLLTEDWTEFLSSVLLIIYSFYLPKPATGNTTG